MNVQVSALAESGKRLTGRTNMPRQDAGALTSHVEAVTARLGALRDDVDVFTDLTTEMQQLGSTMASGQRLLSEAQLTTREHSRKTDQQQQGLPRADEQVRIPAREFAKTDENLRNTNGRLTALIGVVENLVSRQ